MRRLLIVTGVISGLLLVLAGAVMLLLPAERVGSFAAARAAAALDRDVEVRRFRVQFLPRPAVALQDVRIGGPRAASDTARFASAHRLELRPRILPLFRRQVIIDHIVIDRPEIYIEIAEDGTSNLPEFAGSDAGSAGGGDVDLDISRLRVKRGMLSFRDARDGTAVRLSGVEQRLAVEGTVEGGELTRIMLAGFIAVAGVDAELPGRLAWPLRGVALSIDHRADLDRVRDRLELDRLIVTVQELALTLSGSVSGVADPETRTLDLVAGTGSVDVARLLASLPRGWVESGGEALEGAAGRVSVDATARGRAGGGAVPDVTGTLRLEEVALARGRHGRIADGIAGDVAFSLDSVSTAGIAGRLLGEPLRAAFSIRDLADPTGRVTLSTALAMAEAQKLGFLPDGTDAGGRVVVDVSADGSLVAPEDARIDGTVTLSGITLRLDALEQPVVVRDGRIALRGRAIATRNLTATIGASEVALDFDAIEWLPYVLGDTMRTPTVTFAARSARFDADEIFGVDPDRHTYSDVFFARLSRRQLEGRSATEVARDMGLGLPQVPPIDMDGTIRAARLINGAVQFDDVEVTVAARARALDIRAASFRMMGGGVRMSGRLGVIAGGGGTPASQPLALDYTVDGVTAAQFLERYATFRDHIGGRMQLTGSIRMYLDEYLLPITESMMGDGTIAIADGELVNWPLLRVLGQRIGVAGFDTVAFRDWSGRYRVAGGTVFLDETAFQSSDLVVRAAGSFDVTGILDIGATVYMPQRWAARLPGAPTAFLANLVAEPDGRVPVGARISGTARDPVVRMDLSAASARGADAVREAARSEAREMADRLADELADRLPVPPRDSLATAADSLKQKVEDEVVNRLRRVLRPGARDSAPE
jgi:hypothetical protein